MMKPNGENRKQKVESRNGEGNASVTAGFANGAPTFLPARRVDSAPEADRNVGGPAVTDTLPGCALFTLQAGRVSVDIPIRKSGNYET
jgi:hypothetical protein